MHGISNFDTHAGIGGDIPEGAFWHCNLFCSLPVLEITDTAEDGAEAAHSGGVAKVEAVNSCDCFDRCTDFSKVPFDEETEFEDEGRGPLVGDEDVSFCDVTPASSEYLRSVRVLDCVCVFDTYEDNVM